MRALLDLLSFDERHKTAALEHARISVASGDAQAMSIGAFVLANITRDYYETAIHTLNQALRINANSASTLKRQCNTH